MSAGSSTRPLPPGAAPDPAPTPSDSEAPVTGTAEPAAGQRRHALPAVGDQPEPFLRRYPVLGALGAGVLLLLAFAPFDVWPLAALGAGLLALTVRGCSAKRGAWLGFACGLAFFVPLLQWSGTYVGVAPWMLLALSQAAFFAPLGAALAAVQRLPAWPVWAAALWVTQEALRDRVPFGGFPWGRLAFSQPDGPFTAYAAWGGAPLLTFTVALVGSLLAHAVLAGWPLRRHAAVALAVALAVPGAGLALRAALPSGQDSPTAVIAVVQGNVPRLGLDFNEQRQAVLNNHVQRTVALAEAVRSGRQPRPDVVIWPENSSDIDPIADAAAGEQITEAARAIDAPILIGAILNGPGEDHRRNAGILWYPDGDLGPMYVKRHPVPFAEYIPMRTIARKVSDKVDLVPRDLVAGKGGGVLRAETRSGDLPLGDVICFEVAYDGLVRDTVRDGAKVIVVQTNNATFGRSAESAQQLAMSRIRAIEHGRSTLVSATSGISAVIDPDGSVRWQTEIFTPDAFSGAVSLRDGRTLATRLGALPEWLLLTVGLGAVAYLVGNAVLVRRRSEPLLKENA